jgi:hypothetical protein
MNEEATDMSKKPALALVEEPAEGMNVTFVDPPEGGEVAPLEEPPAEGSRDLVNLKDIETEVMTLCDEPIRPTSIATEIHNANVVAAHEIQGKRQAYASRKELLLRRFEEAAGMLDERISDCDRAIDFIVNGIGQAPDNQG